MSYPCENPICNKQVPVIYWDRVCKLGLCLKCSEKHDKQHDKSKGSHKGKNMR